ncbi:MAG: cytochrome ubiquinol oxidase subunit I [Lentisphaerae bacterium]|nr:cytochrome ubiquinol oxidase subunit I [Lentisphaerota bacterium]
MDALTLARWQFGVTTVYHFFFVPLTLGLSILVALFETMYVRTGDETYRRMTKFWGKLFLINFAMGVATGIVQEFQFGMNWSEYSRYVGDIFGAPLAVEALLAFFLESTFLGIWVFGWDKLSRKAHAACMWAVAIGSNVSAVWILLANSWMQEPVGYAIRNGRAEMTDFLAVVTNPHFPAQFLHVFFAGVTTAGFFVLAVSAWHLWRKRVADLEFFRRSFRAAAVYALVGILATSAVGHEQGRRVVRQQPMKMAAAEALWETESPAGLSLFSVIDEKAQTNTVAVRIPRMLSLMAYNRLDGEIRGIRELQKEAEAKHGPGNYIPPVTVTFWSFRVMVGSGLLLLLLAVLAVRASRRNAAAPPRWLLPALVWAVLLPYIGNSAGWMMTEIGRQPWIVQDLLRVDQGLSIAVTAGEVLFSLIAFTLLYGALMVADVWLLRKYACMGPAAIEEQEA